MHILLGLQLDDQHVPIELPQMQAIMGPNGFLTWLEGQLGLLYEESNDYLRMEQYRQSLKAQVERAKAGAQSLPFYHKSLESDSLATASALLARRDELRMLGWDRSLEAATPNRLTALAEVEQTLQGIYGDLHPGFADRFALMREALEELDLPLQQITLREPEQHWPPAWQAFFEQLRSKGIPIHPTKAPEALEGKHLGHLQRHLRGEQPIQLDETTEPDGSILIFRAKRETDLAIYLAKLFPQNPSYRPLLLIPEKNRALDNALIQEGQASLGILSDSLARPTLQILKLVGTFLWKPLNPYKLLEFLSLQKKPFDEQFAKRIASVIAARPGIGSASWNITVARFFEEQEAAAEGNEAKQKKLNKAREQYNFWFNRRRVDADKTVDVATVIEVFRYVERWARDEQKQNKEQDEQTQNSLLVLRAQARRIVELLEVFPESERALSALQLERIVRTVYEPAPLQFRLAERDHLEYLHQGSAILAPVPELLWWNFTHTEQEPGFPKWYQSELRYLEDALGWQPESPAQESQRKLWQRRQAPLYCQERLIFLLPDFIEGRAVLPHPLLGDLKALFGESYLEKCSLQLPNDQPPALFEDFDLPKTEPLPLEAISRPRPFVKMQEPENLQPRDKESHSSLQSLFYYPYQWVFKYKVKLNSASLLSVVDERRLYGNLAHSLFEGLFEEHKESERAWTQAEVEDYIQQNYRGLMEKEGAVLLLYGRDPDRINFVQRTKYAAWTLVNAIQQNGWRVWAIEKNLSGKFKGIDISGIADLILCNDKKEFAIIDLKWSGKGRRSHQIINQEDLQLVLYSRLLCEAHPEETVDQWAHTAYFIIQDAQLLARNDLAFGRQVQALVPDADHLRIQQDIWDKMQATYDWRMRQFKEGLIEIRTEETLLALEEEQELGLTELSQLLSMPRSGAPFDDYAVLVSLLE